MKKDSEAICRSQETEQEMKYSQKEEGKL